jgi:hypothetical protein
MTSSVLLVKALGGGWENAPENPTPADKVAAAR